MRRTAALTVTLLAAGPLTGAAEAKQTIAATPNPVEFGETVVIKGAGWPVIEFCKRTVRLSLRSDQNAFALGRARTRDNGRFRFEWVPWRSRVGAGQWRVVARMRCESGNDGSPVIIRASAPLRIRRG